ncbi:hypothetical protein CAUPRSCDRAFT_13177 [Caulochytrium protostelioides]|uniref:Uncharacterized protein n=1 Tax=Caulochytrium protostelioides TaxID=1555241 RepID=A0A4P9WPV5_9FUNG|nr:hypothetical protein CAUPRSCDRAFT_13177 [Caulochytrium protostelioides]
MVSSRYNWHAMGCVQSRRLVELSKQQKKHRMRDRSSRHECVVWRVRRVNDAFVDEELQRLLDRKLRNCLPWRLRPHLGQDRFDPDAVARDRMHHDQLVPRARSSGRCRRRLGDSGHPPDFLGAHVAHETAHAVERPLCEVAARVDDKQRRGMARRRRGRCYRG